jgi:hypothetical protein
LRRFFSSLPKSSSISACRLHMFLPYITISPVPVDWIQQKRWKMCFWDKMGEKSLRERQIENCIIQKVPRVVLLSAGRSYIMWLPIPSIGGIANDDRQNQRDTALVKLLWRSDQEWLHNFSDRQRVARVSAFIRVVDRNCSGVAQFSFQLFWGLNAPCLSVGFEAANVVWIRKGWKGDGKSSLFRSPIQKQSAVMHSATFDGPSRLTSVSNIPCQVLFLTWIIA